MVFDPDNQADETSHEGHLDQEPMGTLLGTILRFKSTGRITIRDDSGPNHLFFMQGRPVGVVLSQVLHPLGQLLLELGKVDSAQFVKAQRLIGDGERLPGQVFMEIGAITDAELKETLAIQARRKAQKFVSMRGLPYEFNKGLSFLTGFKSNPMEGAPLLFHALSAQMDVPGRKAWLQKFGNQQVRAAQVNLGAPLDAFGFGRAEERFLQRLAEWHTVQALDQNGTLPPEDMAALLNYLEALGQLEVGAAPAPRPAPAPVAPAPAPPTPAPVAVPRAAPKPAPVVRNATPTPMPTQQHPAPQVSGLRNKPVPKDYGPAPNSAIQITGARDITERREAEKSLPSVMVDYDSLGPNPRKG